MPKVRWTTSAIEDLDNITCYLANSSQRYSIQFRDDVLDLVDSIAESPYRGWQLPEYEFMHIRERLINRYRIIYRIKDEHLIELLAIIHGARRLPPDLLR